MFWTIFAWFGVLFIPLIVLFLVCGADWTVKIGGAIASVFIWVLCTVGVIVDQKMGDEAWNNGVCSECNGEYIFSGASENKCDTDYYYTCEDCHHTIETNQIKK